MAASKSKIARVSAELAKIRKRNGRLLPADVVKAARPKTSPIHNEFEWDDGEAAERWRLHQARNLIAVCVVFVGPDKRKVREYTSLTIDRHPKGGYVSTVDALRSPETRGVLLEDALAELEVIREKYGTLTELAAVFEAMDKVTAKGKRKKAKRKTSGRGKSRAGATTRG